MKEGQNKSKHLIIVLVIAILIVIAAIFAIIYLNTPDQRVKRLISVGEKYLSEMDYEEAALEYKAAIEIDPNCVESYVGLSEAYIGLKEYDSALDAIKQGESYIGEDREFKAQKERIISLFSGARRGIIQSKEI